MQSQLTPRQGVDEFGESSNVDILHELLLAEIAAVESYDRLIGGSDESPAAAILLQIREDHSEAVAVLRERIRHFGGSSDPLIGLWDAGYTISTPGMWPVETAAPLAGLKEGEETGIGQYESALIDPEIDTDCKDLIRYRLLPRCQSNVLALGRIEADCA